MDQAAFVGMFYKLIDDGNYFLDFDAYMRMHTHSCV